MLIARSTVTLQLLDSYLKPTSHWTPTMSGVEPLADNLLMNGQNTYDCSVESSTYSPQPDQPYLHNCAGGQLYTTQVRPGETVRLRLINSSSFFSFWFSIDSHDVSIVELDGVEIQPISSRGVYINIGQRVSVLVRANQTVAAGNYHMRATIPKTCYLPYAPYTSTGLESAGYQVRGILSYHDGTATTTTLNAAPIGVAGNTSNPYGVENNANRGDVWEGCDDMPFDMPVPMRAEPAVDVADANTHYIEYMFRQAQDVNRIFVNKARFYPVAVLFCEECAQLGENPQRVHMFQDLKTNTGNAMITTDSIHPAHGQRDAMEGRRAADFRTILAELVRQLEPRTEPAGPRAPGRGPRRAGRHQLA